MNAYTLAEAVFEALQDHNNLIPAEKLNANDWPAT